MHPVKPFGYGDLDDAIAWASGRADRRAPVAAVVLARSSQFGYDSPVMESAGPRVARATERSVDSGWTIIVAGVLAACLVLLDVGLAAAQPFRVTFQREPDEPSSIVLRGEVVNDGLRDIVDVWVTADALSAEGKVVGRGIAHVASFLRGRASRAFIVKLPRVAAVGSFRLAVSSFRYASGSEVESP
jgi:hypothetical protein